MPTTDTVLHPGVILFVTVSLSYIWSWQKYFLGEKETS